jgi:hypothetical protein
LNWHLFLLRLHYSSPDTEQLARVFLLVAAVLAVHQLLIRSSPTRKEMERTQLRGGLLGLVFCLGVAALLSVWGYQGAGKRGRNLEIAGDAPVRFSYGAQGAPLIQVFTAPGCGPCHELEGRLAGVIAEGYAVQYIPSPLSEDDWGLILAAVCAPDARAAFERLYRMQPPPQPGAVPQSCDNSAHLNEAALQRLTGRLVYPTVVMPDGFTIVG